MELSDESPPPPPYPNLSACCISHEFHKSASKSPNKIAIIHATTASPSSPLRNFTFSQILTAVENTTSKLSRILHKPHSQVPNSEWLRNPKIVGIFMEPSVEYIVAVLSVIRCGEAFLPLDPTWPKQRLLSVLESSKTELVLGYNCDADDTNSVFHKLDDLQWLIDDGRFPVLTVSIEEDNVAVDVVVPTKLEFPCEKKSSRSFCYVLYTSGSSGYPKGVCGTEIGLVNRFLWKQEFYPVDEGDVFLFKTSISFVDHLQEFLEPLLTTCTLVIPPFNRIKENVMCLVDFLQGYFVSRLVAVPSLMRTILPVLESPFLTIIQDSLKLLVISGEIFPLSLCKRLMKLLPQTTILNLYGSTEAIAHTLTAKGCHLSLRTRN